MAIAADDRTAKHCVFLLHAHLVFVTKYRGTCDLKLPFKT